MDFEIGPDDDGKVKSVSVSAPGEGPCSDPRKSQSHHDRREDGGDGNARGGGSRNVRGPAKPKDPFWHDVLSDHEKGSLEEKGILTSTGTINVSVGDARVKLGTRGYSSMAHAEGIFAD